MTLCHGGKAREGEGIVGKGYGPLYQVVREGLAAKVTSKSKPAGVQREPCRGLAEELSK